MALALALAGACAGDSGGGGPCVEVPPSRLSDTVGLSNVPAIAATADGWAIAWQDDRDGNVEIYAAFLSHEGTRLGPDVRVTNSPGDSASPSVAWNGTELGVTWYDDRDGNTEIYFARLDGSGAAVGGELRVTNDAERSEFPSLVASRAGWGVAWNDTRDGSFQIYATALTREGVPGPEQRVTTTTPLAASPSLAATNDGLGVAWYDTRGGAGLEIYFALLDVSGARTSAEALLSDSTAGGAGNPSIVWNDGLFAVAWMGRPGMGGEAWVATVDATGAPVGQAHAVTSTGDTVIGASIATDGDGFALAYVDRADGDGEVWLARLDAAGQRIGEPMRITDDGVDVGGLDVHARGSASVLAWSEALGATSGETAFALVCSPAS